MKNTPNLRVEQFRVHKGPMGSDTSYGHNGAFLIPYQGTVLTVISSDGSDMIPPWPWEHVSVSTPRRCPTWEEMVFIKDLFWRDDEIVFQLHPAKKDYVNCHPHTLHLWRHREQAPPMPPMEAVGPQDQFERMVENL
jgi:hypothetical protein